MDEPGLKYRRLENQNCLTHFAWEVTYKFQSLRNIALLVPMFFESGVYIMYV